MCTSLAADPASAAAARRFVRRLLERWHLDALAEVAMLLTSELVSNAVLHGRADMELRISCAAPGRIRVEVTDHGRGRPTRRRAPAEATSGRGLDLVHLLAADWGVARLTAGKTVWFELATV